MASLDHTVFELAVTEIDVLITRGGGSSILQVKLNYPNFFGFAGSIIWKVEVFLIQVWRAIEDEEELDYFLFTDETDEIQLDCCYLIPGNKPRNSEWCFQVTKSDSSFGGFVSNN